MRNIVNRHGNIIKTGILLALSYMTGLSLAIVYGYGVTGIDILIPCLMLFAGVVYRKAFEVLSSKEIKYTVPIGFLFALTVVLGSKMDMEDGIFADITFMDIAIYPFLGLFFSAFNLWLFSFSDSISAKVQSKNAHMDMLAKNKHKVLVWLNRHPYISLFVLYVICYLPYYLTFFPGNCGNDTWKSLDMVEGNIPWTNHHPVLFTGLMMMVRKVTAFLPLTGSIGVFSFLQMLAFAAVLSYLSLRIIRTQVHVICKLFAVAMFALHPFMGMYSVYLTKDVLFSIILILLCMKVYDIIAQKGEPLAKPKECTKLSMLFLLTSMLRNNGMYIAIIMAVIFLFLYRKHWKQILILFICAIGLFQIWQGPVFKALGIEKQSFAEAASIPLQQVGYVLWEGGTFSESDMAFLEKLMPIEKVKEVYTPGFTDPYKFDEEFNDTFLNENVGEFLKVWWNGCKSYFGSYVEAYLMQTSGYWHYGETNTVCTQGCTENELGVEQIDVIKNIMGVSLEPVVEKWILVGRKAPIVCVLGSMAMQMMMVFLLFLQYMRRNRKRQAIWLIPLVILWGTIMVATPSWCLLRYLFPIFLLWPFMIMEFLKKEEQDA